MEVSQVIREWLEDKTRSLDYIYKYDPPTPSGCQELSEADVGGVGGRVCDPYITVEDIEPSQVEEIVSLTSSKRLERISGRCGVRLRDGTEVTGSWREGVRQGLGSLSSPHLDDLGVAKLAGSYTDGQLTGVARLHMKDGSIREGWFLHGLAHGPFKGDIKVKVVCWPHCLADLAICAGDWLCVAGSVQGRPALGTLLAGRPGPGLAGGRAGQPGPDDWPAGLHLSRPQDGHSGGVLPGKTSLRLPVPSGRSVPQVWPGGAAL